MNKIIMLLIFGFVLIVFSSLNALYAQYIIEQVEYEVPINYDWIPEDAEFDDQLDEAKFFLEIPESKFKKAAQEEGKELGIQKSTIYIDGNNMAVESESAEGKITFISHYEKSMFYYVIWPQKKVFEVSSEEIQGVQKKAVAASDEMLKHLPPEQREQIKNAMKSMKGETAVEPKVTKTGKKMKKYNYDCEQYIIEDGDNVTAVWASDDILGLSQKAKSVSEKFTAIFPSKDYEDKDEWDLVPGKIPIEVRTFRWGMMGQPEMEIQAITKITKTKPPAIKFIPPGKKEGFTKGSFMEMMQGRQDK